jgi:hypothetical protein
MKRFIRQTFLCGVFPFLHMPLRRHSISSHADGTESRLWLDCGVCGKRLSPGITIRHTQKVFQVMTDQ